MSPGRAGLGQIEGRSGMSAGPFHGWEQQVRSFGRARAVRVVHGGSQKIEEHAHDWSYLMLPILGEVTESMEGRATRIAAPAVSLHAAHAPHANCIGEWGFESLSIEFDPKWLANGNVRLHRAVSRGWTGIVGSRATWELATAWRDERASERDLANVTKAFLLRGICREAWPQPTWLRQVETFLRAEVPLSTAEIAGRLNLHPAWLARAYRGAVGEGLHDTIRRQRIQRAVVLLRSSSMSAAGIAVIAGFCDQSHMNRAFAAVLDRTPGQIRAEAHMMV
jgi:AraC family transcriptional regulator